MMTAVTLELCDAALLPRFVLDASEATLVRSTPCSVSCNAVSCRLVSGFERRLQVQLTPAASSRMYARSAFQGRRM